MEGVVGEPMALHRFRGFHVHFVRLLGLRGTEENLEGLGV